MFKMFGYLKIEIQRLATQDCFPVVFPTVFGITAKIWKARLLILSTNHWKDISLIIAKIDLAFIEIN